MTARLRKPDGDIEEVTADRVILAIGITGNVEGLGLEERGVRIEKGHIVVDEWCRTGVSGLYAIGDVVGPPWLAHKASHEGIVCVEKIAGIDGVHPLDNTNIPGCTYSSPQIASVGLTEEAARQAGHELKIGRFPYSANGKAIALGETEGLVKTIFDAKSGALHRRASHRRRSDRADPGLRHRQNARDHRGRADGDHLPPPDIVGDDGRIGARRLRPRASHLIPWPGIGEPDNKGSNFMSLIIFLVVGLIAGALASWILGRQQDLLVNLLIGIIGAVVGGLLAGLLGLGAYNLIGEIIIATIGAIICILVWQRMR